MPSNSDNSWLRQLMLDDQYDRYSSYPRYAEYEQERSRWYRSQEQTSLRHIFANINNFKAYFDGRQISTGPIPSNFYREVWELYRFLYTQSVTDYFRIDRARFLRFFSNYETTANLVDLVVHITNTLPIRNRVDITYTNQTVTLINFDFLRNIQNGETTLRSASSTAFTVSREAPIATQQNMLPMPSILPEDETRSKSEIERLISDLNRNLLDYDELMASNQYYINNFSERKEILEKLLDLPVREVSAFLQDPEYRYQNYGYYPDNSCNCIECRIKNINSSILAHKNKIEVLRISKIDAVAKMDILKKELEEASKEVVKPAIFMPNIEFACERLQQILSE